MIAYRCLLCRLTHTRLIAGISRSCPRCSAGPAWLKIQHAEGQHKQYLDTTPLPDNRMRSAGDY